MKFSKQKIKPPTSNFQLQTSSVGFTLIEILVVFSIIAVLSALGVASFVSYSRSQQVTQTSNNLKQLINQARANALSVVKSNSTANGGTIDCQGTVLVGYSVVVVGTDKLTLNQLCGAPATQEIKSIMLPSNFTFTTGTNCTQILFDSLSSKASGVPCNIVIRGYGQNKTITIDAIGNTSIQ